MPSTTKSNPTPATGSETSSTQDTSQPDEWNDARFRNYYQTTSAAPLSSMPSQESGSGPTRSVSQGGPTTAKSGRGRVRASRSPRQGAALVPKTNGTSGPSGSDSSASACLQSFLVSRLRPRTDLLGSTLFTLTWKDRVMPSGRSISALRASVRRTSGSASTSPPSEQTSWATPASREAGGTPEQFLARKVRAKENGSELGISLTSLSLQAQLAVDKRHGLEGQRDRDTAPEAVDECGVAGALADDDDGGFCKQRGAKLSSDENTSCGDDTDGRGATNGFWSSCDWIPCRDGKSRPVEPGTFPLAHGAPARVGRLRTYGNAIVAPLATEFIKAVMASTEGTYAS